MIDNRSHDGDNISSSGLSLDNLKIHKAKPVKNICIQEKIIIIPPLRHFTILEQKNAQNMLRYYTVKQGKNTH